MTRHTPRPEPVTAEQLRLAWRQISRPGWPATLEAALAHPVYRACLHGIARNLGRAPFKAPRPAPPPAPALPALPPLPLFDERPDR